MGKVVLIFEDDENVYTKVEDTKTIKFPRHNGLKPTKMIVSVEDAAKPFIIRKLTRMLSFKGQIVDNAGRFAYNGRDNG